MKNYLTLFIPLLLLISSCKKNQEGGNGYTGKDLILTVREQQKAEKDNDFTFKLLKQAAADLPVSKNMMLSPLSVSMALGMTSNGASASTLDAIRNTLEFSDFTEAEVNSYYQKIIAELPTLDPRAQLNIANSIWYRNGFEVMPAFLKSNSDHYKAEVQELDFTKPKAKDEINTWVSTNTNGEIPTIVDNIKAGTVMYLINAVYFKSDWASSFDKDKTVKGEFTVQDGSKVQADFMTGKVNLKQYANSEVSLIELAYGNERYSMVIALPAGGITTGSLAQSMTADKWGQWMSLLKPSNHELKFPKFKFEYDITLNDALSALGMSVAFSDAADFTRLNSNGQLRIDEVKHNFH